MIRFILPLGLATVGFAAPRPIESGRLELHSPTNGHFQFTGAVGDRVDANVENWLLRAPQANPGLVEMFRVRDRDPVPQLVPWAGEFVGKYLISAVQGLRMTDDPRLFQQVSNVVHAFIATQAEDGYLGPFPRDVRLLKHWDLWGHYHAMQGLLLWHERTGDPAALAAARKAADLVCRTFLDTERRVVDAGSPEMNMAILTGMAWMYLETGEARYLRMAHEVEKDWETAGDYLRSGLEGREFYLTPKPRWESLHCLQGLVELWRVTGEPKYRDAFVQQWRSIRRWDRRNSGGFSSGEKATGNPYAPTAIETCCTVAWMALTIDYLKLTGDVRAADNLELSTLNGGIGAQHPSGRWWTYNTPMDGKREASAHTIVFQARAGTPELNCCSANAPRVLGMLSEWSVMTAGDDVVLNSYVPGTVTLERAGGRLGLKLDQDYPRVNRQRVSVVQGVSGEFALRLRIPEWSRATKVTANFSGAPATAVAGSYLEIKRPWKAGDEVTLEFDFNLRAVAGAREVAGKVSLYRGPLLLAYDQAVNAFDAKQMPDVDLSRLAEAKVRLPGQGGAFNLPPWLEVELPTAGGALRLVDFASAGQNGTDYRSWLKAAAPVEPPAFTVRPYDGERIGPGQVHLAWQTPATNQTYRIELAADADFTKVTYATNVGAMKTASLEIAALPAAMGDYWWRVVAMGAGTETRLDAPAAKFVLDANAPPQAQMPGNKLGPAGEVIFHSLRNHDAPRFGNRRASRGGVVSDAGTRVNGDNQMLAYSLAAWPERDFSVALRVRIDALPSGRIGQVFSAWTASQDDPLRLTVENGELSARVEAGKMLRTKDFSITAGEWYHVAAVKRGTQLELFVNGKSAGSIAVPDVNSTTSEACALGGNPRYSGNEFLAATFADFGLWDRALTVDEIKRLSAAKS